METTIGRAQPIVEVSPVQIFVQPFAKLDSVLSQDLSFANSKNSQNIFPIEKCFKDSSFINITDLLRRRRSTHSTLSSSLTLHTSQSRQNSFSSYNETILSSSFTSSFKSACSLKRATSSQNLDKNKTQSFVNNHSTSVSSSFTSIQSLSDNEYHPLQVEENIDNKIPKNISKHYRENNEYNENKTIHPIEEKSSISFLDGLTRSLKSNYELSNHFNVKMFQDVPLETFSQNFEIISNAYENINFDYIDSETRFPIHLNGKTRRIREPRINSKYLLLYSLVNSLRKNNTMNDISDVEINIFDDLLLERYSECTSCTSNDHLFNHIFKSRLQESLQNSYIYKSITQDYLNQLKLASVSRYKIWAMVELQPRDDPVPNINTIADDIIPNVSLSHRHVPWLNINDIKSGKAINRLTKTAGLLKYSNNIQFVSKTCYSKKWGTTTF